MNHIASLVIVVLAVAGEPRNCMGATKPAPPKPAAMPASLAALAKKFPRVDVKRDCGARGDGVTNDTAAFQKAAERINAAGGGTLVIPKALYIVGEQRHVAGQYPYYKHQPIFEVTNLQFLRVEGNHATLRVAPGLRFGAFDKDTGEVYNPTLPFYNYDYQAQLSGILSVTKSRNVLIKDLELDGNLGNLILGGLWGDTGRQVAADGLYLSGNSDVTVRGVNAHHNALDGVNLACYGLTEGDSANPHTFIDCGFEYNGRQGMSWVGGRGLKVYRCKFNHTGRALNNGTPLISAPGAGLDIEAEDSICRDGYFEDCEFVDNAGPGMVADQGPGGYSRFTRCTFWGTTNWSVWSRKPGLTYEDCKFYGSAVHAFGSPDATLATTWTRCVFQDKPWTDGTVYRGNSGACLLELNGNLENVKFDACTFTANTCKSIWISAAPTSRPRLADCTVTHGKADLGDHDFMAIFRHVAMKDTRFKEAFPGGTTQQWSIETQNVTVEGGVHVDGPCVKWLNWSWGIMGDIPSKTY